MRKTMRKSVQYLLLATCTTLIACGGEKNYKPVPESAESKKQALASAKSPGIKDPYVWLEDVSGEKALNWVRQQNERSLAVLEKLKYFRSIHKRILEIVNSNERIPVPEIRGNYIYNFWRGAKNVRGLLRRTSLEQYKKRNPEWETVLDIDELAAKENKNWVYKGASYLEPACEVAMILLSRGGADATEKREFDLKTKTFVKGGFILPEAKSEMSWIDRDTVFVATDFGEGTLTDSGYPRIVKIWKRGTPLEKATTVYEGEKTDVGSWAYTLYTPERTYQIVRREITFYTYEVFWINNGKLVKIEIPEDAEIETIFKKQMLVRLKSDWKTGDTSYRAGSLISIDFENFNAGDQTFTVLFNPTMTASLSWVGQTKNSLLISVSDNVVSKVYRAEFKNGNWKQESVELPGAGTVSLNSTDIDSDRYFYTYTGFLTPSSLYLSGHPGGRALQVKSLPAFFKTDNLEVTQYHATSADGTRIPFFVIGRKDLKNNSANPTLLHGYGGFEVSMQPAYSAIIGSSWLEKGGVYALANIRGGGEFGPRWHQAALKKNRHKAYEDFIAVAEKLIALKITAPLHLGIRGNSNGGLLMGVMITRRPDLFGAVICKVPLLDMRRYNKLLAGASWIGEYGDPDKPDMWEYIRTYSPYHNLRKEQKYPKVFFTTSTRDDRVHPGHARKMVARMNEMGHPNYYYENIVGGHGGATDLNQEAYINALEFAYLWDQLAPER